MAESLADILIAITEIQGKLYETIREIKNSKDEQKNDFLDMFKITCESTIKDLINEAEKVGHFCSVCKVVLIDNKKTKVNCASCVEDFEKCKTIMNLGQFAKRQLERVEIFKEHSPKEITVMQLKEDLS